MSATTPPTARSAGANPDDLKPRESVTPDRSVPAVASTTEPPSPRRTWHIANMPAWYFLALLATIAVAAWFGTIPNTMIAGFAVTIVLGGLLHWIGDLVPVLRDFGLPTILCTFVPTSLLAAGLIPQNIAEIVPAFVKDAGFLDFFVIAVICGSILGMPRDLLIKAGPRFAVPVIGCLIATFGLVGLLGLATGFGFLEAVLMIAAPIMAGGLGVGAVPMSQMYAARTGTSPDQFMGDLISAVVFANVICILIAGLYNGLGRRKQLFVGFNGHGQLMRIKGDKALVTPPKKTTASFLSLGTGLAIAGCLLILGTMLGHFLPFLHPYAWTIIAAALVKILRLFPAELEDASAEWGDLMTTVLVPALLVGVSLTYIDITEVLQSMSNPSFLLLSTVTVIIATLTSGVIGWLVKFNFIEAAITPGLVMADTGGSGDVSVLSAANRMHLMPFAALTNRVGGALVLFVTSLLVPFLG